MENQNAPIEFFEVRIKVFEIGTEEDLKNDITLTGGDGVLQHLMSYFAYEKKCDPHLYTMIIFKNGTIVNTSEKVTAHSADETVKRLFDPTMLE